MANWYRGTLRRTRPGAGALLLAALLAGCGPVATATGSARAALPAPGGRPTATAVAVPFVGPEVARTVGARFALTPHPTATATVVPTATPQGAPVAFAAVEKLLSGNCAGCHPPNQGLDLTAGHVYANIVNVPSREVPSLVRVKPGDPADSYLYQKVTQAKPKVGGRMPLDGAPLSGDEIATLRAWIAQGAKGP